MSHPLRIGLITGEYPPMQGGIGAHCARLASSLAEEGHQIFVFTDVRGQTVDPRVEVASVAANWGTRVLGRVRRWAEERRLDVLNVHFQTAAFAMSPWVHFLPDRVGRPVVTTFHDLRFPYLFPKAGPVRPWIVNRLARASAGVISTNHEDFLRLAWHPQRALIPIGSSIDGPPAADDAIQGVRRRLGLGTGSVAVAYFGFINHSKGVDVLLHAVRGAVDRGVLVDLWIVGDPLGASDPTNTAQVRQVKQLIEDLSLSARVSWTGPLTETEVASHLRAADIVALPFRDGASFRRSSLMAAIGAQAAIVTTRPTTTIDTFIDGENLLYAERGDAESLTRQLVAVGTDAGLREHLREGAGLLSKVFSWSDIARAHITFFRSLLERQA